MHVLLFNLRMDLDDPVLGFTNRWVEAIAERVDRISVITMEAGRVDPPDNVTVHSLGKERGWSEPRRAAAFYQHCSRVIRGSRPDVCFSHMIPVLSVLFAPIARSLRIPTLLWYAHGAVPRELRIAERLVDRCVTSTPEGFRIASGKLHVVQQGIDVERLAPPNEGVDRRSQTIVSVGRIGPVKRLLEAVEAMAMLRDDGVSARLEVFGSPATPQNQDYERRVRALIAARGLVDAVVLRGQVRFDAVEAAYHRGSVFLNLSRSGSLDKAILEAMACGCIPVSNNDAFAAVAGAQGWTDLVPEDSTEGVAATLARTLSLAPDQQSELRAELREYVVLNHSLRVLVDRIVGHLSELRDAS